MEVIIDGGDVAGDDAAGAGVDWFGEHGAVYDAGVEFAVFAERVDFGWEVGEEVMVEAAAGEGPVEVETADVGDDGTEALIDHFPGELGRGLVPEGEDGSEASARELGFAVVADVLEEEIAEGEGEGGLMRREGADAVEEVLHGGFVALVGAGVGNGDFVQGQAEAFGLELEHGAGVAWMATRSSVALTVVKMPRTSQRSGRDLRRWNAQAESLPEDQEARIGSGRRSFEAMRASRNLAR